MLSGTLNVDGSICPHIEAVEDGGLALDVFT